MAEAARAAMADGRALRFLDAIRFVVHSTEYGALRDVMGDSAFHRFLRGYYSRWAFKHVDETAMRSAAERVHGEDLRWFFDQWIHRTGLIDYAVRASESREVDGGWLTRVKVEKRGEYWHPVPVGVRTAAGWTMLPTTLPARSRIGSGVLVCIASSWSPMGGAMQATRLR